MASSVSVCPDDPVGVLDVESRPKNGKQISGRRKVMKSNEKKKQPQRGLGVAQLERLRFQERWKKISTHHDPPLLQPHHTISPHTNNHYFVPASFPDPTLFGGGCGSGSGVGVNKGFLLPKLGHEGFSGQVGSGQVQDKSNGFGYSSSGFTAGNVARETLNELSSMPNVNCYYSQCDLGQKETEVLAVHRKKGSLGGGHGSLLMEYEFFPEKVGTRGPSDCSKDMELGLLPLEDSVGVRVVDGHDHHDHDQASTLATRNNSAKAVARFGGSNSVDLSLKLSY